MTRKLLRPAVLVVRAAWAGCTKLIQLAQILNARKGGRLRGRPWPSSLREIAAIGGQPSPPPPRICLLCGRTGAQTSSLHLIFLLHCCCVLRQNRSPATWRIHAGTQLF